MSRASGDPRYSAEVLRRFCQLPGAGPASPGNVVAHGRAGDRELGAEIEFDLTVQGGLVASARFRAFGCPHVLAAASWVTEAICGLDHDQVLAWEWQSVASALDVPPAKFGRLLTLQDALRAAARNWPVAGRSTV